MEYSSDNSARANGYNNNKDVLFKSIESITIQNFRSLKDRKLKLGKQITLITGKNGTMKSSILGLIAHPFASPNNARDLYGQVLKTDMRDIFKLSFAKDTSGYSYFIDAITSTDKNISEKVRLYNRESESRFRVTVGKDNSSGLGAFHLNSSYLNLKRLFPIIDTNAQVINDDLTLSEKEWIAEAYNKIMQRTAFSNIETVSDKKQKNTCGPVGSYYDFNSISSGEDNLGAILFKMLAFKRNKQDHGFLQSIFCIDEVEASLHPVAQVRLFDFLVDWSKKHKIQIIVTTHSLYLIDHCLRLQLNSESGKENITLNNISTMQVGHDNNFNIMINPDFKTIYKELTYKEVNEPSPYKVFIICEDDVAKDFIKKLIGKRNIINNIEFITNVSERQGSPWTGLISLAKNGKRLLDDAIIILDPDVKQDIIDKCNYKFITKIPDVQNRLFSIEKIIVKYIFDLSGDNPIFKKDEKSCVNACLSDFEILPNKIDDTSSNTLKSWKKKNKQLYNKAVTSYIKENRKFFDVFVDNILVLINERRSKKALPPLFR